MLAYILALIVGLSSIALYMAAFFFPEVHRKHDFLWSGLGMFYALVLWVCAGRITGGVLLGQTASVVLLGWMGWQMLALRRQVAPVDQQTPIPTSAEWQTALVQAWTELSSSKSIAPIVQPIGKQVAKLTAWVEALVTTTTAPPPPPLPKAEPDPYVPLTPADFADAKRTAAPSPETGAADHTIVADVTPVQSEANVRLKHKTPLKVQPPESLLTAVTKQVQSVFKGLSGKQESKPVYVRKQFRTPDAEPNVPVATAATDVKESSHAASVSTPQEPLTVEAQAFVEEQAILEVIDATIAEVDANAEADGKDLASSSPDNSAEHSDSTPS
ncbi:MAG: Ycf66 family protein [Leptolyngbya sp. BL-A-14]